MYLVSIKPVTGYPRAISNSNKLTGLLKMILGNIDNISFNNGEFQFKVSCPDINIEVLINLIKSEMKKIFLDPFYLIEWREL